MNRTLVDRVRCMLMDAELSRGFWAETLQTAVKIINNVPCKGTHKRPDELWFNRQTNVDMLRVFGCMAFAHVPSQKRRKLDDKGVECIFIGYAEDFKAYRLYCKTTKKIIISRDVDFMEHDFKNSGCNDDNNNDFFY